MAASAAASNAAAARTPSARSWTKLWSAPAPQPAAAAPRIPRPPELQFPLLLPRWLAAKKPSGPSREHCLRTPPARGCHHECQNRWRQSGARSACPAQGRRRTPELQLLGDRDEVSQVAEFHRNIVRSKVTAQVGWMAHERRRDFAKFEGSLVRAPMMFQPCFLAVEKKERMTAKSIAPSNDRKPPEIFWRSFIMRPSRSA